MKDFDNIGALLNTSELRIAALKGNVKLLVQANESMASRGDWRDLLAACAAANIVTSQVLIGILEEQQ
jgi:hypothetical protein